MLRYAPFLSVAVLWLCQPLAGRCLRADAILLKSGGEVRGELQTQAKPAQRGAAGSKQRLTIRTLSGSIVSVPGDDVEQVLRRRLVVEEYETLRRAAADTVVAQWELAEWCRRKPARFHVLDPFPGRWIEYRRFLSDNRGLIR